MLKIAICDDSLTDRVVLEKLLRLYGNNQGIEMHIDGYHSAELLFKACNQEKYSLVFMDIYLGGMQGNEAARILVESGDCCVIFTTSSVEFALEGFEIGVFHYVVKPYDYDKIAKSMEKYVRTFYVDSMAVLRVKPVGNEPEQIIRQKDICYIESFDKIRCIHTRNGDVNTYMTINEINGMLLENVFCRPHRSYVVNLDYVKRFAKNELELEAGRIIPISRSAYEEVAAKYARYKG